MDDIICLHLFIFLNVIWFLFQIGFKFFWSHLIFNHIVIHLFSLAGQMLSMGYGFVEYKRSQSAHEAVKKLQHLELDGHQLELKISNRVSM